MATLFHITTLDLPDDLKSMRSRFIDEYRSPTSSSIGTILRTQSVDGDHINFLAKLLHVEFIGIGPDSLKPAARIHLSLSTLAEASV